jgi:hypothetical protein
LKSEDSREPPRCPAPCFSIRKQHSNRFPIRPWASNRLSNASLAAARLKGLWKRTMGVELWLLTIGISRYIYKLNTKHH